MSASKDPGDSKLKKVGLKKRGEVHAGGKGKDIGVSEKSALSFQAVAELKSLEQLGEELNGDRPRLALIYIDTCPYCLRYMPTHEALAKLFHTSIALQDPKMLNRNIPAVVALGGMENVNQAKKTFGFSFGVPFLLFSKPVWDKQGRKRGNIRYIYGNQPGAPQKDLLSLDKFMLYYPGSKITVTGKPRGSGPDAEGYTWTPIMVQDINPEIRLATFMDEGKKVIKNPFTALEEERTLEDIYNAWVRFVGDPDLVPRPTRLNTTLDSKTARFALIGNDISDFIPALYIPVRSHLLTPDDMNYSLVGELYLHPERYRGLIRFVDSHTYNLQQSVPQVYDLLYLSLDSGEEKEGGGGGGGGGGEGSLAEIPDPLLTAGSKKPQPYLAFNDVMQWFNKLVKASPDQQ